MWKEKNESCYRNFILLGLLDPNHYGLLFLTFILIIFMVAVMGNKVLILLIRIDLRLHTPMYFFLSHLSLMDIFHMCNIIPRMVYNYISGRKSITFVGCGLQIYLYSVCVGAECLIITVMSYDRYVAICHPLRYPILMSHRISVILAAGCWLGGMINSTIHVIYIMHLPFCGSRIIDHFFCEVPALLKLSSVDISQYEEGLNVTVVIFILIPLSIILSSYGHILRTVFQIKSMEAQKKAFSTCSSHLTVVILYYAPFIFTYMRPRSYHTPGQDKILAITYTIFTPMLNPIIYSFRNKDVLCALKKFLGKAHIQRNENLVKLY
ncbi:olfactory receptor 2AJ1-like [Macrotis lagotis]|uniref:olfactory receptor 2AJ1-like n=1 Tax=Macrotis lagotis TaxID=92651 RepID=UPI003D69C039